ncbi:MAG: Lrp/AsnC family transcriptional regulator [Acidimicrobiales bacterium]|nr:Lrp/AsnC family transcriptional regulator [Hyphomonadaceae bacterium]RZV37612.1 MAG: Lrp/AsnC family transcriptional regulator [Acidimicrobiales bacterium]
MTNLDEIDKSILRTIQSNGRISTLDLSESVGLSATPCGRRLKKLENEGVVCGYHALIDESKIGYGFSIFVSIQLDKQIDGTLKSFESAILLFPEVVDCWLMTGNRDYLMRIAVADLKEFEYFLTSKLTKVKGVASIESSIPVRQVKSGLARGV